MSAPDSFTSYVLARRGALLRTAYLLTGDADDAEDLVQVALVKASGAWRRIEDDPEPYVRRILVNENVSRWRRRRWREVSTDRLPEVGHDPVGRHDQALVLRAALQALAPRQRAVVVLRYFDDLTERQTAELLGVSVGTVKSQARDGLARLREALPAPAVP
ncbi:SigE family RNA polymerase sigma factor [Nocardioides sp. Leaf374]|uniref:SigE family RNA polymerase sigma factor n=1 Tax=Nocardioides sp. Leaf374 TaxID=2876560 RepID=UPI001E2CC62D|nr:SigE family RNA polymerase sigma factor [Nocardioides sp. Leaf374]